MAPSDTTPRAATADDGARAMEPVAEGEASARDAADMLLGVTGAEAPDQESAEAVAATALSPPEAEEEDEPGESSAEAALAAPEPDTEAEEPEDPLADNRAEDILLGTDAESDGAEVEEDEAPPPVVAAPSPTLLEALPAHLFDWAYYRAQHAPELASREEALAHFHEVGFAENRNPSAFLDVAHVRFLAEEAGQPLTDADSLFRWCGGVMADALLGLSPRYSPAWISAQLLPEGAQPGLIPLAELLARPVGALRLSLHPALRRLLPMPAGTTVGDAIRLLAEADATVLSHVDLPGYTRNHRDLAQELATPWAIFDHCWSVGLRQNRLKHLGTTAPRRTAAGQLMINAVAVVHRRKLDTQVVESDLALGALPQHGTAPFPCSIDALRAVRRFDAANPVNPPALADVLALLDAVESRLSFFIARQAGGFDALAAPAIGPVAEITDADLLSGARQERGRRVVYSINLGLYDDNPVPPELDDCAYYLITDAATIEPDLPWRVVRPTLAERDRKRLCLWYKTHPHLLFPGAEHSIWIDGNIECLPGSERVLEAQEILSEVSTFRHPDRDCIYEEGKAVIALGLDVPEVVNTVLDRVKKAGMPRRAGLFETNVLYAKPRDAGVSRFMDRWWREIFLGSRRDQMSFTFAAFQCGIVIHELDGRASAKNSRFFRKRAHRRDQGRSI